MKSFTKKSVFTFFILSVLTALPFYAAADNYHCSGARSDAHDLGLWDFTVIADSEEQAGQVAIDKMKKLYPNETIKLEECLKV